MRSVQCRALNFWSTLRARVVHCTSHSSLVVFSGLGLTKLYATALDLFEQSQCINSQAMFLLPQKDAGVIKKNQTNKQHKQQNVSPNSRSCLPFANLICLLSAAPCQRFCSLQRAYESLEGGRNVGSLSAIRGCVGGSGWGTSGTA